MRRLAMLTMLLLPAAGVLAADAVLSRAIASELREAGFEVSEGVGGTGVVAIMKNGKRPMVMVRADMDGLPMEEKPAIQKDQSGREVPVAHSCGHDMHMASLVGTARMMARFRQSDHRSVYPERVFQRGRDTCRAAQCRSGRRRASTYQSQSFL